jgi:YggT family protein
VSQLLCTLLNVYFVALFARIILSWFPMHPGSALTGVFAFLFSITEPVLGPVRRMIPSFGMFDLSPLIVIFGIQILGSAILGCRVGVL